MTIRKTNVVVLLVSLALSVATQALPAFPGAEGFGSDTIGGRGGQVIEVTNLDASGAGSLRAAVETSGPRIVVFKVGGTILLTTDIRIREPYITIAGQTAPGDGILIRGAGVRVQTHDVIIRGLRIRVGDDPAGPTGENRDGLGAADSSVPPYNIIFDHCSVSWAIDENMQTWYPCHDITLQWSVVGEALADSLHPEGVHSMGFLVGDHSQRISVHHNLFVHNRGRNPLMKGDTLAEVVNNVVYNWGYGPTNFGDLEGSGPSSANVIGNTYLPGVDSNGQGIKISSNVSTGTLIYAEDNVGPGREDGLGDDWLAVQGDEQYRSLSPVVSSELVTIHDVTSAYDVVLAEAGASVPARDAVDLRMVQSLLDGTGGLIDSQDEVGGWPSLAGGTPPTDGDHDGMPDDWELARTLDPNDPNDAALDRDSDGYTNIEEYINGLFDMSSEPALRVIAPNGGEPWSAGTTQRLTWSTTGAVPEVTLAYSSDNGGAWTEIAAALANNGTHDWLVPSQLGDQYLVRVADATDGDPSDTSNATFSVVTSIFSPIALTGDRLSYIEHTPARWWVVDDDGDLRYFLNTSSYDGRDGSGMGEYTLIEGQIYADFELRLRARSPEPLATNTSADIGLVFGLQDDANYYYLMLNANAALSQLFRMVAGQREELADIGVSLIPDNDYHDIVLRRVGDQISLVVDGVEHMTASDSTYGAGGLGFGSFNDSAYFDEVEVVTPTAVDGGVGDAQVAADGSSGADVMTATDAPSSIDAIAQDVGADASVGQDVERIAAEIEGQQGCACRAGTMGRGTWSLLITLVILSWTRRRVTTEDG